jgi:CheY-like chemotaxis protein
MGETDHTGARGSRGAPGPAVRLTAYAGIGDSRRARAAGFQRGVAKPVDPSDLVSTVRYALIGAEHISAPGQLLRFIPPERPAHL